MIPAQSLIDKANQAYAENWGYIWGKRGQIWTERAQRAATRLETVKYGSQWIGHRVADCAGLIAWAVIECGGKCHLGSNLIWSCDLTNKGAIAPGITIKPGSCVFKRKRKDGKLNRYHVGWYVGNGEVIEARGTQSGVLMSRLDEWREWGELKGVDYSEVSV